MELVQFGFLAAVRVTALVWTAPLLGHQAVALWIRLVLAGLLALVAVLAGPPSSFTSPLSSADLLGQVLSEALVGLLLGLSVSLFLLAGEWMAELISQMAGVSSGEVDEAGDSAAAGTRLVGLLTLVLFVLARGPEYLVDGVLESLHSIPPGSVVKQETLLPLLGELVRQGLGLAVRGVGPAVAALLTATTAVNLLQRVVPGAGFNGAGPGVGMFVFALSLYLTVSGGLWLVDGNWEAGWSFVRDSIGSAVAESSWAVPSGEQRSP
jgi:flagellar biosynthetic protein FliR